MLRLRLRFMSIRGVPNVVVYHHPLLPEEKPIEGVRMAPTTGLGLVFRAAAPSLEKIKVEEKVKEVTAPQEVSAQTTS